jgi:hypothetical protein
MKTRMVLSTTLIGTQMSFNQICRYCMYLGPVRLPTCILNLPHKIEMQLETFSFSARGHRSANLLELAI